MLGTIWWSNKSIFHSSSSSSSSPPTQLAAITKQASGDDERPGDAAAAVSCISARLDAAACAFGGNLNGSKQTIRWTGELEQERRRLAASTFAGGVDAAATPWPNISQL